MRGLAAPFRRSHRVARGLDAGTPLAVAARVLDGAIGVDVADDGPGLPEGAALRVFEKYYRGAARPRGFGLGLPICKAIVTAHGGAHPGREPRAARGGLPLHAAAAPVVEDEGERT